MAPIGRDGGRRNGRKKTSHSLCHCPLEARCCEARLPRSRFICSSTSIYCIPWIQVKPTGSSSHPSQAVFAVFPERERSRSLRTERVCRQEREHLSIRTRWSRLCSPEALPALSRPRCALPRRVSQPSRTPVSRLRRLSGSSRLAPPQKTDSSAHLDSTAERV